MGVKLGVKFFWLLAEWCKMYCHYAGSLPVADLLAELQGAEVAFPVARNISNNFLIYPLCCADQAHVFD